MKIYTKLLLFIFPLLILALLLVLVMTQLLARNGMGVVAEDWLDAQLESAVHFAELNLETLQRIGLDNVASNVEQAQQVAKAEYNATEIGLEGSVFVVNGDGIIQSHPDAALVGADISDELWFQSMLGAEKGSLDYRWLGASRLAVYEYFEPWEWYIVVSDTTSEINEPINQTALYSIGVAIVSVIFIGGALAIFTSRLTSPLGELTEHAKYVAEGHFDREIEIDTSDEIGTLAGSFNDMTRQMRVLVGGLENQVRQRTEGLELAAEIGGRLTQITDRRELLETAVNLIGDRFHLYYTQIYLVDSLGQTLRMQAGTGEVGEELFLRAHYLSIGKGSINGLAAEGKTSVVIEDTHNNKSFHANPLLPYTRSEMAVPLLVGTRLLGTLNMQDDKPNGLTKQDITTFNVLASQLAIAFQNAELFAQTLETQMMIQSQARQLTHDNWDTYLNAVDRQEHIVYSYDQLETKAIDEPLTDLDPEQNGMQTAVFVNREGVGRIQLLGRENREWTDGEQELLDLVARQVGQRIENLRLLDETDRYRNEAEQAFRRVTREGWDAYQQQNKQTLAQGYQYDGNQVAALDDEILEDTTVSQLLIIGGQKIGSLSVDVERGEDKETAVLLEQVAAQLSSHIETLRLEGQTEDALANAQRRGQEMARLNQIVARISKTLDLKESLRIVAEELVSSLNVDQCSITLFDESHKNLVITAAYPIREEFEGLVLPVADNLLTQKVLDTQSYVFVADAQNDPIVSITQDLFREMGIQSVAIFPIIIGDEVIGTVGLDIYDIGVVFSEDQLRLAETIIGQAATTVQNARLFEQTELALAEAKQRSQEMATVNRVAQIASQQTDVEPLLQAIYTEVGKLMDVGTFHIMLYNAKTEQAEYPMIYEQGVRTQQESWHINPESYSYRILQGSDPILHNLTPEEVRRDSERNDLLIGTSEDKETVSVMYAPLRTGQEVTGTLSIQSYQYDAYTETDLSLLVSIANYVAIALESARLFEQTRARARQERFLREISERVHTAVDAESVLRTAAREINRSLGLETVVYLDSESENAVVTMPKTNGEQANG